MSNAQWPTAPQGRDPRQPFGQPPQGRDPRQPFGQQPPTPPSLEDLEPPKRSNRAMVAVLGVVAVIVAIVLGMQFIGGADPQDGASTAPSATAEPSPERTGNFIPFEGNGDGIFEIVGYSWGADRLNVRLRVEVTHGDYAFSVFAFTNETRASYEPVDLRAFSAREGEPFEGNVTFLMPQADATIVLSTPSGRVALNALPIKG
ncbi:hypothetical protein GCM10025789_27550 [Tessaracoccus lubricantis]|uniref:DUF4352 domain-containing protein n=1 Tax=Tessaracoccus lubricantis TaxID=545543 RepID=A0ABP9FLG4_9ACTN